MSLTTIGQILLSRIYFCYWFFAVKAYAELSNNKSSGRRRAGLGVETLSLAPHKLELNIKFRESVAKTTCVAQSTRSFTLLEKVSA